jgi:4-hydroxythreonine-4-phosphate dehydrogenase
MTYSRVAVTTGDPDGIGSEVACKALAKLGAQKSARFLLWRSPETPKKHLSLLDKKFDRVTVSSLEEALKIEGLKPKQIVDICSTHAPAKWVESTALACLSRNLDAIVTGPLSKTSMRQAGFRQLGHTEILKNVSQSKNLFMGFLGNKFNVMAITGHIPLKDVPGRLSADLIEKAIMTAHEFTTRVMGQKKKPLALVGLNPHAGEAGLIGGEEETIYQHAIAYAQKNNIPLEGPLVPDAAFLPANWKKFSMYVCPYHDQALIPFKMIHTQDSGAHVTLGLPFVRTSVDHGTAKDIFNKNKANPNSMLDALHWAMHLLQKRSV